jgi:predicted DNA-binding transcriptional regulator AlpA
MKDGLAKMQLSSMLDNMSIDEIRHILVKCELMNTAEVARLIGWNTKKVSKYRERGIMPDPIVEIGRRPVWLKSDIEEFLKKGGLK